MNALYAKQMTRCYYLEPLTQHSERIGSNVVESLKSEFEEDSFYKSPESYLYGRDSQSDDRSRRSDVHALVQSEKLASTLDIKNSEVCQVLAN